MKKTLYLAIVAVLVSMLATSCKTSEENYKAAYDIAARKQIGGAGRDVSGFIEREKRLSEYTRINGDTVRVLTQQVRMIDGDDADVDNFGVVVGDFKQVFNARSFRERINAEETTFKSYVVINGEKRYYVIYRGFDSREDAAKFLNAKEYKITPQLSEPWVLEMQK